MRALAFMLVIAGAGAFAQPTHATGRKADVVCPSIMQPVCAKGPAGTRSFPNRCLAEGAGYAVVSEGRCESPASRRLGASACPREDLTVCGESDSRRKTFHSACETRRAEHTTIVENAC